MWLVGTNFRGSLEMLVTCWFPMMVSTLLVNYYGFRLWAFCRKSMKSEVTVYVDVTFLLLGIVYLASFIILPLMRLSGMPFITRAEIVPEQVKYIEKFFFLSKSIEYQMYVEDKNDHERIYVCKKQRTESHLRPK